MTKFEWSVMMLLVVASGGLLYLLQRAGRGIRRFAIIRENQQFKVSLSRGWFVQTSMISALGALFGLSLFIASAIFNPPQTEKQWWAMVFLGWPALSILCIGTGVALVVAGARKVYTFDRLADRVLQGKKLHCRIGEIDHLQIDRVGQQPEKVAHELFIVLRDGKRYSLYGGGSSADELFELAKSLSDYLGVRLVKPES